MSLDQIKLNGELTTALYEDLLVDHGSHTAPNEIPFTPPPMLGDYARNILILVQESNHAFLSDEDLGFLTGVITACKMSLADVGIVNLTSTPIESFEPLRRALTPRACWIFGIHPSSIGLNASDDLYHSQTGQPVPIFWAPSLAQLATDPTAKRALWAQLKKQYGS